MLTPYIEYVPMVSYFGGGSIGNLSKSKDLRIVLQHFQANKKNYDTLKLHAPKNEGPSTGPLEMRSACDTCFFTR